jgi:hypothetical protein
MKMFLLIALLKTPGEGGTVQLEFDTLYQCWDFGAQLEQQFEAIESPTTPGAFPVVMWTCVATN